MGSQVYYFVLTLSRVLGQSCWIGEGVYDNSSFSFLILVFT